MEFPLFSLLRKLDKKGVQFNTIFMCYDMWNEEHNKFYGVIQEYAIFQTSHEFQQMKFPEKFERMEEILKKYSFWNKNEIPLLCQFISIYNT